MSPLWIIITLLPVLGGAERFNCKNRILGAYYADAKSGCKAFHVCVRVAGGGIRDFRFFCPPGTLFHQEAQTCTDWGDDDPLACPADIYDGQFDLYRIGSGYDTKKLSSPAAREEETEFGLQRAETGDRRLSQNNAASNGGGSDLRAAHSSDFFTGQRDRGRDDSAPPAAPAQSVSHTLQSQPRQSFRRSTTPRPTTTTTEQYTAPPPQPSSFPPYETSKRKFVRKRPVSASTSAPIPTTYAPNTPSQEPYFEQTQQNFNRRVPQNRQSFTTPNTPFQNRQTFTTINVPIQRQTETTPDLPPQFKEYKDEYVEVSRVTPKQNKFYNSKPTQITFQQSTVAPNFNKKQSFGELYNNEAQSTPAYNLQNENQQSFKVKNGYNVADVQRDQDYKRNKNNNGNYNNRAAQTTTSNYNNVRNTNTPSYKNYNSVPYEPEKINIAQYSKNNYFNAATTAPTTTTTFVTSTYRPEPPANLNTIAYNTNIGFNAPANNFDETDEDDGQYRPPQGEDDGLYRPELYETELLSGAHSLNIAASGNRLPEERKNYAKTQSPSKLKAQTASPRPFRPAPVPTGLPTQTTRVPEVPTTTVVPQTINTQRTFDYYQTYTTTSRPSDVPNYVPLNNHNARTTTSAPPKILETRPTRPHSRGTVPPVAPTAPPTHAPRPTTRAPHFAKSLNKKEDTSYDYAYYDSDPGFSEYDQIEEFGRTKVKT